ncbi:MAG: cupin domain-containing protein [Steroidobacteraceae bacterium]
MKSAVTLRRFFPAAACGLLAVALLPLASAQNAQAPIEEPALARSADDASLQWGPCPAFLPEGCGIAVLHGDPSKPNVDILFRVPGKSEIPLHTHTSAERMILVAGELHVTYQDQETARLTAGMYAYGPPTRPHSAACISDVPCVLFIAFEAPLDAIPSGTAKP